jgi:hypothetical protein
MARPRPIDEWLRRVSLELRLRRAERGALRGAFWGGVAAVAPLAAAPLLGELASPLAIGAAALGTIGGALVAACGRVSRLEAARLADRALGLQDRVATALEWASRPDRGPLVAALVADTEAHLGRLEPRRMLARRLPREARLLPLPLLAAAALAVLPPVTGAGSWLPEWLGGDAQEKPDSRSALAALESRAAAAARDALRRDLENRELAQALSRRPPPAAAESAELFRDKALAKPSPDFASFLKQGDDRLRMLENADRLPDLQADFASSKYQRMLRQTRELAAARARQGISPRKLAELLREMERLGRQSGDWGDEVREGLDALEHGRYDDALEAMESALDQLRELEEHERGGRPLLGRRESDRAGRDAGRFRFDDMPGMEEGDESGAGAGVGRNPNPTGKPTARLRSQPYTTGVEGVRRGRRPGYESQMRGNASPGTERELAAAIAQYRRSMEDAITREQVPRDYHEQIRDYFKSLNELGNERPAEYGY